MPVKRRVSKVRDVRITPEAVELFRRGLAIQKARADRSWEDEGGKRREYLDTSNSLHRQVGLKPWHPDVFEVDDCGQLHRLLGLKPWHPRVFQVSPPHSQWSKNEMVIEIRRQLERALAEAERAPGQAT